MAFVIAVCFAHMDIEGIRLSTLTLLTIFPSLVKIVALTGNPDQKV